MSNNKKRITFIVLLVIVIILGITGTVIFMNKDNAQVDNFSKLDTENNYSEINENKLIPGVEYYAPERDIDGVTFKRFSFFIGNDHKILTYINEDKESEIMIKYNYFDENNVCAEFVVNKINVTVSDDSLVNGEGEAIKDIDKTLVAEENGIKYYVFPYKKRYYIHYFETVIDGIQVSFSKSNGSITSDVDTKLFAGIKELASKLSVNDKVGLWADGKLNNYYADESIALKSAKLFNVLCYDPTGQSMDKILIGDYKISLDFFLHNKKGKEVDSSMVVMGEIADQKYGYKTSTDIHGNTDVYVYIYKSELREDKEIYTNKPSVFLMYDLNKTDLTAEQFADLVVKQVIEIPK